MTVFWKCITAKWTKYFEKIEYITDPSVDLVEQFKKDIINFEDLTTHPEYIPCNHVERSQGHMLFILRDRVEVMLRPIPERKVLLFVNVDDITAL